MKNECDILQRCESSIFVNLIFENIEKINYSETQIFLLDYHIEEIEECKCEKTKKKIKHYVKNLMDDKYPSVTAYAILKCSHNIGFRIAYVKNSIHFYKTNKEGICKFFVFEKIDMYNLISKVCSKLIEDRFVYELYTFKDFVYRMIEKEARKNSRIEI